MPPSAKMGERGGIRAEDGRWGILGGLSFRPGYEVGLVAGNP
jgi:hypothetical protein